MKYATIILAAALAIAMAVTFRAEAAPGLLAPEFAGDWCVVKYDGNAGVVYKRIASGQRCKQNVLEGSGKIRIHRDGFNEETMRCTILEIQEKAGRPIRFRCVDQGIITIEDHMLLLDGDRLRRITVDVVHTK